MRPRRGHRFVTTDSVLQRQVPWAISFTYMPRLRWYLGAGFRTSLSSVTLRVPSADPGEWVIVSFSTKNTTPLSPGQVSTTGEVRDVNLVVLRSGLTRAVHEFVLRTGSKSSVLAISRRLVLFVLVGRPKRCTLRLMTEI